MGARTWRCRRPRSRLLVLSPCRVKQGRRSLVLPECEVEFPSGLVGASVLCHARHHRGPRPKDVMLWHVDRLSVAVDDRVRSRRTVFLGAAHGLALNQLAHQLVSLAQVVV